MKIPSVAMRLTAIALAALLFAAPAVPQPARFKTPSASVTGLLTQPQVSDWGYITRFGPHGRTMQWPSITSHWARRVRL